MNRTIKCLSCPSSATVTSGNVGDIIRESNYHPLMTHEGSFDWLCPLCKAFVKPIVDKLLTALGGDAERVHYLYWPSLLKLVEKS